MLTTSTEALATFHIYFWVYLTCILLIARSNPATARVPLKNVKYTNMIDSSGMTFTIKKRKPNVTAISRVNSKVRPVYGIQRFGLMTNKYIAKTKLTIEIDR